MSFFPSEISAVRKFHETFHLHIQVVNGRNVSEVITTGDQAVIFDTITFGLRGNSSLILIVSSKNLVLSYRRRFTLTYPRQKIERFKSLQLLLDDNIERLNSTRQNLRFFTRSKYGILHVAKF